MGLAQKKSVRILGAMLAVLVLLVVAVKIFLPVDRIRDLALDQARAQLGREVSVGPVAVSLKGGLGVRLEDFTIHNPEGFGGEHLLTSRAVDLKLAIKPLFKGEVRVDRLVIDTPVANLVRRVDGTDNFTFQAAAAAGEAEPAGNNESAAPPPLSVASLTLKDGQLSYADESAEETGIRALKVAGLTAGLSLTDPAPGKYQATGRLNADRITVTGPSDLPDLDGSVDFDLIWNASESRLDITRAELKVLDLPLSATGQVVMAGDAPAGKIQIKATDLALVDLDVLMPPKLAERMIGDETSGRLDATIDLDLTGEKASPLHTFGMVSVKDADLALAGPFLPPGQPGRLAGRGDLELTFDHQTTLTYSGRLTARGASFTETELVDELRNLEAVLSFTPELVTIENCEAKFASGTVNLRGTLSDPFPYFLPAEMKKGIVAKRPHLRFAMRSPRLDVDQLVPAASPTGRPANPPRPNPSSVLIEREFPDLSCEGTFRADSLIYMQVPYTEVTGQAELKDRILILDEVKGQVYNGQVAGQMEVDLNDLAAPVYAGTYQARDIEINEFVTRFAGLSGVVFGGCNMEGSFVAWGRDPETIRNSLSLDSDALIQQGKVITTGKVHQALNQLAAQGGQTLATEQALRDLATHISVENGRVGLNNLKTRLGQFGDLTVGGYYGFNGDLSYTGSILLTKAETDRLFSSGILKELAKLLGSQRPERLELPLSVGGTRADPKVKLDLGSVTSDLQQRAVKEQGSKLEDEAKGKLNDLLKKWR